MTNASSRSISPHEPSLQDFPSTSIGWFSTALLAFMYWLSVLDRTIISLLVDPIKQDLGITDVQFGMLHGLAFAVTFSIFGLVAGTLADRYNRRMIIFFSVTVWSLATAACGMAQNFVQMLLARVGVGAGEAGLTPCATSMLSDLFHPSKLTLAIAVYALGASVGSGCAYLFGGMLVDAISQYDSVALPLIGEVKPWQATFYIIGIPGVAVAFMTFLMPEPKRLGQTANQRSVPISLSLLGGYRNLLKFMGNRKKFFFCHYAGFGFASMAFVGGAAWYPAHMGRTFGWDGTQIGLWLGIMLVAAGLLGKFLCGHAVGYLYRKGYKDAQFVWYSLCLVLATPAGLIGLTSTDSTVFLVCIGIFLLLLSPVTAVYVSSLNIVTPNELRGSGVAFFSATVGLAALSLGPILIAVFSDVFFGGESIGKGMAVVIGLSCPLAALSLLMGRQAMRDAVIVAEDWNTQEDK